MDSDTIYVLPFIHGVDQKVTDTNRVEFSGVNYNYDIVMMQNDLLSNKGQSIYHDVQQIKT